jgi:hypothetical protein
MKNNLWSLRFLEKIRGISLQTDKYRGDKHVTCQLLLLIEMLFWNNVSVKQWHEIVFKIVSKFGWKLNWLISENLKLNFLPKITHTCVIKYGWMCVQILLLCKRQNNKFVINKPILLY